MQVWCSLKSVTTMYTLGLLFSWLHNYTALHMYIQLLYYRSARNNCGYKTLRFLHFGVIFFKMRFLIMRFSSQTRFNKELYEISAVLNYAIVQQLAFFAIVCITQLFLALRYITLGNLASFPSYILLPCVYNTMIIQFYY